MPSRNVDLREVVSNLLTENNTDFLRNALARVLHELMDAEISGVCNAEYGERYSSRLNSRNGGRERPLETRLGTIELASPKLRSGSYFPSFIEARRRWEQAFVNVVAEANIQGISTRKVEALVEAMGAKGMSKSEVSRMAAVLDEQVHGFRNRPLTGDYPYIWVDAIYLKVREGGHVVNRAVLVAFGVNREGQREVLGVSVANNEI